MHKFAILIPNFNGEKFIVKTINNFAHGFPGLKILVVDDKSTDHSLAVLKPTSAEVISRERNGGFAAAVNTGLRHLINLGFTYILVANSDVRVEKKDFYRIKSQFLKATLIENIGVVGFVEAGSKEIAYGDKISGFFFLLNAELPKRIGFFDEDFYMYGEEQDYWIRALGANFLIEQSGIEISHLTEGSSSSKLKNSWFAIRNSLYLQAKHARLLGFLRTAISLFLTINRIKWGSNKSDPSYRRVTRSGVIFGNLFLVMALIIGLYKMALRRFCGGQYKF